MLCICLGGSLCWCLNLHGQGSHCKLLLEADSTVCAVRGLEQELVYPRASWGSAQRVCVVMNLSRCSDAGPFPVSNGKALRIWEPFCNMKNVPDWMALERAMNPGKMLFNQGS